MKIRNLDANGDWTFGQGLSNYISGNAGIGLNISTRLKSWLNDCFFAMNAGVDWKTRLGAKNQQSLLEADLKRIILSSFGVTGITAFSVSYDAATRAFTVNYTINTIFSKGYQQSVTQGVTQNA